MIKANKLNLSGIWSAPPGSAETKPTNNSGAPKALFVFGKAEPAARSRPNSQWCLPPFVAGTRFGEEEEIAGEEMKMNAIGQLAMAEWMKTPSIRPNILLGEFVIMPNHLHGLLNNKNPDTINSDSCGFEVIVSFGLGLGRVGHS